MENCQLLVKNNEIASTLIWKTAKEIIPDQDICFFNENISQPCQGGVGNCWLICACNYFTFHKKYLLYIFNQHLGSNENCPIPANNKPITLTLWDVDEAKWIKIEVDQLLPIHHGQLNFSTCLNSNQLWMPYLEKAVAKKFGSYESLNSGQISESFRLLTGGHFWRKKLTKTFNQNDLIALKKQFHKVLTIMKSIVFVCVDDIEKKNKSFKMSALHYYAIIKIDQSNDQVTLWSPISTEENVDIVLKDLFQYEATLTYTVENLNDLFGKPESNKDWFNQDIFGNWKVTLNNGGKYCKDVVDLFHRNPQYLISFGTKESLDETIVYVALIQLGKRKYFNRKQLEQGIGIHAWKVNETFETCISAESLQTNPPDWITQPEYQYTVDCAILCRTTSSNIVVIPSTYNHEVNCRYLLRISCPVQYTVKLLGTVKNK